MFEELLRTELAELQSFALRMTTLADRRADARDSDPLCDLGHVHVRVEEIGGLLDALHGRFPHTQAG